MAEAFVGEIRLFAFSFAPDGWLLCQGQSLAVNQYQALYALIGNFYGGDQNNFNLPDLRGRVPIQQGQGPLGATYPWASKGGTTATQVNTATSFALSNVNQLPAHSHSATFTPSGGGDAVQPTITVKVSNDAATAPAGATPIANGYIGKSSSSSAQQPAIYTASASSTTTLNSLTATASGGSGGGITGGSVAIGSTGGTPPEPIPVQLAFQVPAAMPPFVAMNYAICVLGIFPPRP